MFEGVALRIVQPNVPQAEKWKPDLLERNWKLSDRSHARAGP